jgi:hypothetical protein
MRVAEWEESKYLVLSSLSFMFPCIYAYTQQLYVHSAVIAVCTFASMNYWRDAEYSYRRTMDICCARASFLWGLYECIQSNTPIWGIGEMAGTIGGAYMLSKIRYRQQDPRWIYYHMAFHVLAAGHAFYGLYVIKRYK